MKRRPMLASLLLAMCAGACDAADSERAVRQVWTEYLTSKQGRFAENAGAPSPHWSAGEQARWPMYDLAGFYLADRAVPEVLSVTPVDAAVDTAWKIVTRFWPADSAERNASTAPALTMTVYARRETGRWVLANALSYHTQAWQRATRGRIQFFVSPSLRFDTTRAGRAARFVDSLAGMFEVPAPDRIDYYVAESVDQAMQILGAEVPERFGAAGGFAKPVNRQVFSGIPSLGEDYRHELAHLVLLPLVRGGNTTLLASEGVPTWFGGTGGKDYAQSVRQLADELARRPELDLDTIAFSLQVTADVRNVAGAVLTDMLYEAGGYIAVREFLQTPSGTMRSVLSRLLGRPWPAVVIDWRRRVDRLAAAE